MRRLIGGAAVALLVAGCGQAERQNAHRVPSGQIDRTPPQILSMPNYFNNVAVKCDGHGHRVFVTSNKDRAPSNIVVVDDETCGAR